MQKEMSKRLDQTEKPKELSNVFNTNYEKMSNMIAVNENHHRGTGGFTDLGSHSLNLASSEN